MFDNVLSLSQHRWICQQTNENQAELLVQKLGLPYAVCRIMAARGVNDETAQNFIEPKLQNLMPDPSCLKDMDKQCHLKVMTSRCQKHL